MRTTQNGIDLIKQHEGCRLTAYRCAAGVWTIGYGHTAGVLPKTKITQNQAEDFLREDLHKYEKKVNKYEEKYRWNQNEFDALVSFSYNIGSIDQLTAGGTRSRKEIALKFALYNKAAGHASDGLTKRRKKEKELFCTPCNIAGISYTAHSADYGWGQPVTGAQTAGTKGKGLEALKINAGKHKITARVHVQDIGWMEPVTGTGEITVGTTGQGLPIEAIIIFCEEIGLTYSVHELGGSWCKPVWNGRQAGTTGKARAIDQISISF